MTNLRNWLFWKLDMFKGSPLKTQLDHIEMLFNLNFDELVEKNSTNLNQLLSTAINGTEFYKSFKDYSSLQDFPVVNKAIIRENFDNINITGDYKKFTVSTSGSTGTPFRIYQSQEKRIRNTADTIYFASRSGFDIGDRLLYLRLWAAYYRKPSLLAWMQNIDQLDVEEINETYLEEFIRKLSRDKQKKGWLGYPSAFQKICDFLDKNKAVPLDANVQSIIAMSEPLDVHVKEKMQYYFDCPVVSRYSNVENGIIAQQMPDRTEFTINWASYFVELLDLNEDKPAKEGALGRIVVTDLFNLATPMIRYDTGDVGIMSSDEKGVPCMTKIEGRRTDILTNVNGEVVSAFTIHAAAHQFPELHQFQLIQQPLNYLLKINSGSSTFQREDELVNYIKSYLGKDAPVSVEYVDEIPLLKSGKRKLIVNQTLNP